MAQQVYSVRLFAASGSFTNLDEPIVTTPTGFKVVVRDIQVWTNGSAPNVTMRIYATTVVGASVPILILPQYPLQESTWQWQGRLVLEQTDQLRLTLAAGGGQFALWISGYQLALP